MPDTDGQVVYEIRADDSKLDSDLAASKEKVTDAASDTAQAVEKQSETASKVIRSDSDQTTQHIKKNNQKQVRDEKESADRKQGYWKKFTSHVKQSVTETKEHFSKATDKIGNAVKHPLQTIKNSVSAAADKVKATVEKGAESVVDFIFHPVETSKKAAAAIVEHAKAAKEKVSGHIEAIKPVAEAVGSGIVTATKVTAAGFAAIGSAALAAGIQGTTSAVNLDQAMNSFAASTGVSAAKLDDYESVLKSIYANNYGENFQDIADSMALVKKNLGDLSDKELQAVTEAAFTLRDTFEYDVAESTRAAKAMMDNFGISGENAMSLIAAGAQNGLDYSGELIDSINEYSVQVGKLGFTADDMFKIFQQGAENGAWNLDKVGDAIKEFSIRAIDGSDATAEGFAAIGLDAAKMSAAFAKGGDTAKSAFQKTVSALVAMEEPLARDAAGVALFGTMWEDLGVDAVASLAEISQGAYDTEDALKGIQEVKYNDLASMFEGAKRSVELLLIPLGEQLIPVFQQIIEDVMPAVEDSLPVVIDCFSGLLKPVLDLATDALPQLVTWLSGLIQPLSDNTGMLDTMDVALQAVKGVFGALAEPIKTLITEALPPLLEIFGRIMPVIGQLASELLPPLIEVFLALLPPIQTLIEALLPPLQDLITALKPALEALAPVVGILAEKLGTSLADAVEVIMPLITGIIDVLTDLLGFIEDVFTGDWESAWDHIVSAFKKAFNLIPAAAEAVINSMIGILNGLIGGINAITGTVGITAIPEISTVSLPRFHTGGIVDLQGRYEAPIMAKDGEMVLTQAQQKMLFDMANGMAYPANSTAGTQQNTINNYYTTDINNHNEFSVRDDSDIERISRELNHLQAREDAGKGE